MRTLLNWKRILALLLLILLLAAGGFFVWANTPLPAASEALAALESDDQIEVTQQNGWYVFNAWGQTPTTGFIFYPGGRVDARAYASHLRAIAAQGYRVVLVPMPLNLAIFGLNAASDVVKAFPEIQHWAVGGHSLGGAMAARFVQGNPGVVQGLILWASYPDIDLSQSGIRAVSIFGTNDAVAQRGTIESSVSRLPADAQFVPIEGGNHSQFGWYGLQPGDNVPGITPQEQQAAVVRATTDLLALLTES
ncbi:MAG: alpha/beta hydrolase [Anaerolineae bacterium]|nr:alpha/beta hydrolase [Anaerolineae bacterium]